MANIEIGGRLHSTATGNVVTGANEVLDDTKNKKQSVINAEVGETIGDDNTAGTIKGRIKTAEGKLDTLNGDSSTSGSVAKAVADAKTELIGGATSNGNTLKKVEDRTATLETAVGSNGSVDQRIAAAKSEVIGDAASDYNTLGKLEDKIQAEASARESAVSTEAQARQDAITAETNRATTRENQIYDLVHTPEQHYVTVATYADLANIASPSDDTVYRVSSYNGKTSQVDNTVYSEYGYNGTNFVFLCVKSQIDEVYDISAHHSNNTYVDLAAALDGGNNIPQELRRGGMSVKFVQSSDHKYVQYRFMLSTFTAAQFTNVANWQGVDEEPVAGSESLVKSGGVYPTTVKCDNLYDDVYGDRNYISNFKLAHENILEGDKNFSTSNYIEAVNGDRLQFHIGEIPSLTYITLYNSNKEYLSEYGINTPQTQKDVTLSDANVAYVRFSFEKGYEGRVYKQGYGYIYRASDEGGALNDINKTKEDIELLKSNVGAVASSVKDIAKESCIRYIETGIRQDNNYYCQVSPLNPNKIYALKIKTSVDGEMTVIAGTAASYSALVDTIANETFTAGVEKTIVGYKPTGAYPFFHMSTANEYTLDLYEYNNGEEIGESVDTAKVLKSCIEHEAEIQEWSVIPITGWLKKMIDTGTGTISTNTSLIEKVIHSDFFKAEGLCKLVLDSGYQIRLLVYSSTKVYESFSIITESTILTLDGTKYYRINLVHGQAGAPGQASNISLSEFGHVRLYKIIEDPEYYKNLLLNTVAKSDISYIESGIRQNNNIYSQISELDTNKIYALKITTAVDGTITVKAGTGGSAGSMVDTIAIETFKANTPKMIYGYKPTGAYKFISLSVANAYTLDLFEQIDGEDIYYQMNATDVIKSCLENEYEMTGVSCIPITGWMKRFIDTGTGEISTNVNLVDKAIHSDFFKASGNCKLILDSGYQIRLLVYSSSKVYESFSIVTASGSLTFDSTKYYRIDLIHGQAGAPAQAADISLSEFNHVRLYRYSANTSSNDTYNTRSKIYGIQINNSSATNNVSRIADAVGLKNDYVVGSTYQLNGGINDFDHIFPWCEMKLCNVKVVDGIKVITYAGETGFTRDGSNGDVMVEIPKFYSMRTVEGNLENICISGEKKSGFNLEPAFYDSETGKELDVIYCGVYLTETTGDVHSSKSGVCPTTSRSLLGFRSCGEMYDFSMVQALQKLMSIEFGSVNLSHFFGGFGGLPYNETIKAYETVSNTNTAVFYTKEVDDPGHGGTGIDYLFVGENITVSEYTSRKATRKITALGELITYDVNGETYHRRSVTFSGDTITVTADATYLYASAQDNGLADNVSYHTGKAGITANNYVDQFKYRNIEGLWGNVGEMMDGIRLKDLEYYICNKKSDYNDITKYTKLSYHSVEQRQYNRNYSFITKMGFDRRYPNINLPVQISSNGSGDDTKFYGDILCALNTLSPSGESIPAGTEFIGINSLAWDGGVGNGPYMYRFWHTQTESQWLYGTRMIYRTL